MADPFLDRTLPLTDWWAAKLTEAETILTTNGIIAQWWGYRLFGAGVAQNLEQLDQAVKVILTTAKGSDIHRPEFSTGIWNYIDYPIPRATSYVVRESVDAVERWEPRVDLETVNVKQYDPDLAGLSVEVSWVVVDSAIVGETIVEVV